MGILEDDSVAYAMNDREKYEIVETLAEDFGDFVLQLMQEQIGE